MTGEAVSEVARLTTWSRFVGLALAAFAAATVMSLTWFSRPPQGHGHVPIHDTIPQAPRARWRMGDAQQVVLIRHGETEWSAAGKHTGRTDIPLTEYGRRQGRDLAGALTGWQFALTLTSPLHRAAETCDLSGLDGIVDDDLREWDYGDHEGRTTAEIRQEVPGWTIWRGPVPGGEHIDQVAARADRVLARVDQTDGHVALFSHGHFLRVLAARWVGLPPREGRLLMLDTATISVLTTERETRAIRTWNGLPRAQPS